MPPEIMAVLCHFTPVVSERIWDWAQVLVIGAILAPRQRTVTAILRIMGLSGERQFQNYHRVLNRARWATLQTSQILLGLLVVALVPPGAPLVVAADETLERRRGKRIAAKGHFRDPVRSSKQHSIASEGLRWVSMMLLVPVPWSKRVWALPFLTVLAPHEQANRALGRRHKTAIDLVQQMITVVRRWQRQRRMVLVTDGGLIAVRLGLRCTRFADPVTFVSRLHLNLRLFDPPQPKAAGRRGPQPRVGKRQPTLAERLSDDQTTWTRQTVSWYGDKPQSVEYVSGTALWQTQSEREPLPLRWVLVRDPEERFKPAALGCTDLNASPAQVIAWYVLRWNVEVTFQESRAHLGVETQRQWNAKAIERTTPALLGLFSLVVLLAHHLLRTTDPTRPIRQPGQPDHPLPIRTAVWYAKADATFVDLLAYVRRYLWRQHKLCHSLAHTRLVEIPASVLDDLVETLCYVA